MVIVLPLAAVVILACHGQKLGVPVPKGRLRAVSAQPGTPGTVTPIHLDGYGVCTLQVNFGDGTPVVKLTNYDLSNPPTLTHVFKWGGTRTITVTVLDACIGGAVATVRVPAFKIGYAMPRPTYCDPVPVPALPKNAVLHITTNPDPNVKINFGCLLDQCVYDADGINNAATPGYPFPGMRPLSLILRVGGQPFQGGTNVTFTAPLGGSLEVCANDDNMGDNRGAWGINLDVDYPGAP
jgi:hypothetical protein